MKSNGSKGTSVGFIIVGIFLFGAFAGLAAGWLAMKEIYAADFDTMTNLSWLYLLHHWQVPYNKLDDVSPAVVATCHQAYLITMKFLSIGAISGAVLAVAVSVIINNKQRTY